MSLSLSHSFHSNSDIPKSPLWSVGFDSKVSSGTASDLGSHCGKAMGTSGFVTPGYLRLSHPGLSCGCGAWKLRQNLKSWGHQRPSSHPFFSGLSAPFAAVHQEALSQKSTENGEDSEPFGHGRRQTSGFFAEENSSGGTEPEYMKKRPSRKWMLCVPILAHQQRHPFRPKVKTCWSCCFSPVCEAPHWPISGKPYRGCDSCGEHGHVAWTFGCPVPFEYAPAWVSIHYHTCHFGKHVKSAIGLPGIGKNSRSKYGVKENDVDLDTSLLPEDVSV